MSKKKEPLYKRIVIKLSGEALSGSGRFGIDPAVIEYMAQEIGSVLGLGVQVGIVIGGGNIYRGKALFKAGLSLVTGDHIGMLATLINSLAIRDIFERNNINTSVLSALPLSGVVDLYDRRKAIRKLETGEVVIFAAGTGNPFVTTDSALSLRGVEVNADLLLKATKVDGVYSADPVKDPTAKRYASLSYTEALKHELAVMDIAAFSQCRDHNMLLRVFDIHKAGTLLKIVLGEDEGTLVHNDVD